MQSIPFGFDNLVRQDCKFERNPYLSRMYDSDVGAYLFELSPNEGYVMAAMELGSVMDKSNAVPILSFEQKDSINESVSTVSALTDYNS